MTIQDRCEFNPKELRLFSFPIGEKEFVAVLDGSHVTVFQAVSFDVSSIVKKLTKKSRTSSKKRT